MRLPRRVLVGLGWAACTVLCGRVEAQTSAGHASLRTPRSGETADGATAESAAVYSAPESSAQGVLREMASRAAVIFSGTVTAVKKGADDQGGNIAGSVVEVDFAVDHTIKGATGGAVYAMREWAGLWRDSPRFAVGQRLLMLLHAPGPGGLSSPVDGLDGAIPIRATGAAAASAPLSALSAGAGAAAQPEDAVDMRWLQAKTLRTVTVADAPVASPGENFAGGLNATPTPGMSASSNATSDLTSNATSNATTMAEASTTSALSDVLGLLASWQEMGHGSH